MNTLERLKSVKKGIDKVMEINQKLKTKEERHAMGFITLHEAQTSLRWAIEDIERLY